MAGHPPGHDRPASGGSRGPRRRRTGRAGRPPRSSRPLSARAGPCILRPPPVRLRSVPPRSRRSAVVVLPSPSLLSSEFSVTALAEFLRRHRRAPIKAVLLLQDRFPGIGNWMADEILWRAGVHPALPAGGIPPHETRRIHREIRAVVRTALATVGEGQRDLPRTWLIHRRWNDGERCPRTGVPLVRETIGGRTTCWSPGRQKAPRGPRRETGPRGRD